MAHAARTRHRRRVRRAAVVPNTTADRDNIRRNADAIVAMMKRRGIQAALLTAPGRIRWCPAIRTPGATRTIAFYAHYDGQPLIRRNRSRRRPRRRSASACGHRRSGIGHFFADGSSFQRLAVQTGRSPLRRPQHAVPVRATSGPPSSAASPTWSTCWPSSGRPSSCHTTGPRTWPAPGPAARGAHSRGSARRRHGRTPSRSASRQVDGRGGQHDGGVPVWAASAAAASALACCTAAGRAASITTTRWPAIPARSAGSFTGVITTGSWRKLTHPGERSLAGC